MIFFGLAAGISADMIVSYLISRRMGFVDMVVIGFSVLGVVIGQLFSRRESSWEH